MRKRGRERSGQDAPMNFPNEQRKRNTYVSRSKSTRVCSNIVLTSARLARAAAATPYAASPLDIQLASFYISHYVRHRDTHITTESSVEHNIVIAEKAVDIAATSTIECNNRQSPVSSHGIPVGDIGRDITTREEPDVDTGALPLHGVDTTSNVVEVVSVGVRRSGCHTASVVSIVGVAVGVLEHGSTLRACGVDVAAWGCVESDRIGASKVHAFDDIDFAVVRPVGPKKPECGPDSTDAAWHMCDVGNEETVRISLITRDADGGATWRGWIVSCGIDTHVDLVVVGID